MYRIYSTHGLFSILYLCAHPAKPGRDKREKYIKYYSCYRRYPFRITTNLIGNNNKDIYRCQTGIPDFKVHLHDALFLFLHPHYLSIFAIIYNVVIF
jgi:hypothetical protein